MVWKNISLQELNTQVEFGVNQEYEGYGDETVPLENYSNDISMNVVSVDGEENMEQEDSISDVSTTKGSDIVVAVDSGHDAKHAGVYQNDLHEEVVTLKIANYLKQELETYEGASVYMTRTSVACPYPNTANSGKCTEQREIAASKAGARIYVSIHLNSSTSALANGAEVIYPNDSWKQDVGNDGKALTQKI